MGHTRHTLHAGHANTFAQVTAAVTDLSGALGVGVGGGVAAFYWVGGGEDPQFGEVGAGSHEDLVQAARVFVAALGATVPGVGGGAGPGRRCYDEATAPEPVLRG